MRRLYKVAIHTVRSWHSWSTLPLADADQHTLVQRVQAGDPKEALRRVVHALGTGWQFNGVAKPVRAVPIRRAGARAAP